MKSSYQPSKNALQISLPVVQKGNPVLRIPARPVTKEEIGRAKLTTIIAQMKRVLAEQDDAVAIAAPQIGESLRLFVVSGKVFLPNYPDISVEEMETIKKGKSEVTIPVDMVFINPELLKLSQKKQVMMEGCLSVRWLYGNVKRSLKATVKAVDENGIPFSRGGSGLLAQIFQHEIDHLNGVLFTDSATDLKEELPEKPKHI